MGPQIPRLACLACWDHFRGNSTPQLSPLKNDRCASDVGLSSRAFRFATLINVESRYACGTHHFRQRLHGTLSSKPQDTLAKVPDPFASAKRMRWRNPCEKAMLSRPFWRSNGRHFSLFAISPPLMMACLLSKTGRNTVHHFVVLRPSAAIEARQAQEKLTSCL